MSEAATTKPSLYDYYKKLIPDTIIFDEVERIAWQNNITCGSFNSRGIIANNGLFFYAEGKHDDSINTYAKRLFLKVCAGSVGGIDNYNTVYLKENLSEGNDGSFQYIVLDSVDNITFTTSENSVILGVKF